MSFGDILFGSAPSVSKHTDQILTPQQMQALRGLIPQLQSGVLGEGYQGASLAALEQLSQQSLTGAGAIADEKLASIINGKDSTTEAFNKYFDTNVQNPALQNYEEQIKPAISRSYGGSNFFGSERINQDNYASKALIDSLTAARAKGALDEKHLATDESLKGIQSLSELLKTKTGVLAETGKERAVRIQQLLQALGLQTKETTYVTTGGSSGLLSGVLDGAVGAYLGKP